MYVSESSSKSVSYKQFSSLDVRSNKQTIPEEEGGTFIWYFRRYYHHTLQKQTIPEEEGGTFTWYFRMYYHHTLQKPKGDHNLKEVPLSLIVCILNAVYSKRQVSNANINIRW